eukprot:SAG31_NODE_6434_length_2021_cov_1.430801_2_plen_289_part_00
MLRSPRLAESLKLSPAASTVFETVSALHAAATSYAVVGGYRLHEGWLTARGGPRDGDQFCESLYAWGRADKHTKTKDSSGWCCVRGYRRRSALATAATALRKPNGRRPLSHRTVRRSSCDSRGPRSRHLHCCRRGPRQHVPREQRSSCSGVAARASARRRLYGAGRRRHRRGELGTSCVAQPRRIRFWHHRGFLNGLRGLRSQELAACALLLWGGHEITALPEETERLHSAHIASLARVANFACAEDLEGALAESERRVDGACPAAQHGSEPPLVGAESLLGPAAVDR